jgi:hypothetical protein
MNPWRQSFASIKQELVKAQASYKVTKKQAAELHSARNGQLYEAMAKKQGIKAKQMRKNMSQIELLRKQVRLVTRATKLN